MTHLTQTLNKMKFQIECDIFFKSDSHWLKGHLQTFKCDSYDVDEVTEKAQRTVLENPPFNQNYYRNEVKKKDVHVRKITEIEDEPKLIIQRLEK